MIGRLGEDRKESFRLAWPSGSALALGLAGVLLVASAAPAGAQAPGRAPGPSYEATQAYVKSKTVATLASDMFGSAPHPVFVRAGVFEGHLMPWRLVALWTKPEFLPAPANSPLAGLCKIDRGSALLQGTEPPTYMERTLQTFYKAAPRSNAAGTGDPPAYCASLDPREFDSAKSAEVEMEAMEALVRLASDPDRASKIWVSPCRYLKPPFCGLDDLREAMTVEDGPCDQMPSTSHLSQETKARIGPGNCLSVSKGQTLYVSILMRRGGEPPDAAGSEGMILGRSRSVLVETAK